LPGSLRLRPTLIYSGLVNDLKKSLASPPNKNKPKYKTLILDLRNCSGGDEEEAKRLVNLFVKSDQAGYLKKRSEGKLNPE